MGPKALCFQLVRLSMRVRALMAVAKTALAWRRADKKYLLTLLS